MLTGTVAAGVERRDVPGFPGYRVGDDGSVWTALKRSGFGAWAISDDWRPKACREDKNGYVTVTLYREGKRTPWLVHALVLTTFVGNPPPGMEACHENGRRADNRLTNLRWGTPKENSDDRDRHGRTCRGVTQAGAKLTDDDVREIRRLVAEGREQKEVAALFRVHKSNVSLIVRRRHWSHI